MPQRTPPRLLGARVFLTLAGPADGAALAAFHDREWDQLGPWLPPRSAAWRTEPHWRRWGAEAVDLFLDDRAVRLVLRRIDRPDAGIVGQLNLNMLARGAFQAATLGYQMAAAQQGQGLMREALEMAIPYAFGPLGLHRLMANHLPENARSAALLQRLGFVREGYAKDYLFIGGAWRDHVLTALTNPDPADPPAA
ncbi:GNAT family N-acetyltransferase [Inquilinus sp. CA228]|uniref:GNAT family N-acetyltransferase n=1 Tax=Inquilinus sp. CA228 TaxID=3455609 RepID=UPI003F8D105F